MEIQGPVCTIQSTQPGGGGGGADECGQRQTKYYLENSKVGVFI